MANNVSSGAYKSQMLNMQFEIGTDTKIEVTNDLEISP